MTTKTDLEAQVEELTRQLAEEREKTRNFAQTLGQMRYRVFEVLQLDADVRNQIVDEIDTVFNRTL
jgi:hypothetical protein|tara:strand:- start:545 stop:742 length:198 start_codon:yes stop_codon:yes gene_type:complete